MTSKNNMPLIICLFMAGFYAPLMSQNLTVTHSKILVSDVTADVWTSRLNDDKSFYEETFEDFTKQEFGSKSKSDGKNEELLEKVSIPQITDKRGDLRLTFYSEGAENKLGLSFLLGYDVWINPDDYPDEMERLRKFTREYLRYHYTHYYNDMIESDNKLIDDYKRSIEKSERSISNMRSQNTRNQERLQDESNNNRRSNLERKIGQNNSDIERLEAEIPEITEKIASLDEHILQIKEKLQFVEEQYYADEDSAQQ